MIAGLDPWAQDAIRVGTGLATGALIGLERGFKLRDQQDGTRVAGVRTFTLLGLGSGIAGLISEDQPFAAGIIILAQLAYLAIAYSPRLKAKGDATSPVAAAATIATAFLGGMGSVGLAIAAAAIIVLILALRHELHGFIDRLDEKDVKALARFAVIVLAVLPFLPDEDFGHYDAWNASKL